MRDPKKSPSSQMAAAAQDANSFYKAASAVKASSDDDECEPDSEEDDYMRIDSINSQNKVLSNPLRDLDEQIFEVDVDSGSHSSSSEDHQSKGSFGLIDRKDD